LNVDYRPIKVITWERAILLLLEEKAELVTGYIGQLVRSASLSMPMPAVVRLRQYVNTTGRVRFNRANLLARDGYTCCYCGVKPRRNGKPFIEQLTLDHVIPRAQSKGGMVLKAGKKIPVTCWANVVTACESCNAIKADRTPEQAGMALLQVPRTPTQLDLLRMSLHRIRIPEEWKDHLPTDSIWRGYWEEELLPG
jgi:5-methylcytosine-specific restriction endonuclease McrA